MHFKKVANVAALRKQTKVKLTFLTICHVGIVECVTHTADPLPSLEQA